MILKSAKAAIRLIRQQDQFSCVSTSLRSALFALGKDVSQKDLDAIIKPRPFQGNTWEEALAAVQYFGCRGSLITPATIPMLKSWTDKGLPVVIAWNPENRPWSHASVVFNVDSEAVYVMDPNHIDPNQTVKRVPYLDFYKVWGEKYSATVIIRRPALLLDREITVDGKQVIASVKDMNKISKKDKIAAIKAVASAPDWKDSYEDCDVRRGMTSKKIFNGDKLNAIRLAAQDAKMALSSPLSLQRDYGKVDEEDQTKVATPTSLQLDYGKVGDATEQGTPGWRYDDGRDAWVNDITGEVRANGEYGNGEGRAYSKGEEHNVPFPGESGSDFIKRAGWQGMLSDSEAIVVLLNKVATDFRQLESAEITEQLNTVIASVEGDLRDWDTNGEIRASEDIKVVGSLKTFADKRAKAALDAMMLSSARSEANKSEVQDKVASLVCQNRLIKLASETKVTETDLQKIAIDTENFEAFMSTRPEALNVHLSSLEEDLDVAGTMDRFDTVTSSRY